ncbi:interleukin-20 receptor subunit alpha [Engraulis encrasicolus]|uniref:interleukin-20 receptor subunit alpha n=1 Tax=Engraulis encrasicolus TaxID=184585 RepID=UPI002FD34CFD
MVNNHLAALVILVVHATGSISSIAPPGRVWFNSTNLHNVVEWSPGAEGQGEGEGTQYSVEYAIYGDEDPLARGEVRWSVVEHCTALRRTSCDLSDETHNLNEQYYARVRAVDTSRGLVSTWVNTTQFDPRTDTVLGPPQVTVRVDGNALDIKLRGPMRWRTKYMKNERSLSRVYSELDYKIFVYNTTGQMREIITKNKSYRVGSLEYDRLYCISAETHSQSIPLASRPSPRHCQTTPPDPFKAHMLLVILGGLLPSAISLFVLIVAGCLVYHYVFGNMPKLSGVLSRPSNPETIPAIEEPKVNIDVINISTSLLEKLLPAVPEPPSGGAVSHLPSYASQRAPEEAPPAYNSQSWQSSGAPREDRVPLDIEALESDEDMPPDYGVLVRQPPEQTRGRVFDHLVQSELPVTEPVPGSDPYRFQSSVLPWQTSRRSVSDDGSISDDLPTVIDWNPSTGVLHIPGLGQMPPLGVRSEVVERLEAEQREKEEEEEEEGGARGGASSDRPIFSTVMVRQPSQDSYGSSDGLSLMETTWQLQINMEDQ